MPEPLLTVRQVAEQVGLSEWAVRRAIHDGELVAFKPRGRLRVDAGAVDAWLEGTRVAPVRTVRPGAAPPRESFRERMRRDG